MAAYTRQSSYTDGDTILADDTNAEFDQLVTVFSLANGHKHDGTAGEGNYVPVIADADKKNYVAIDTTNNKVDFYTEVAGVAVLQFSVKDGVIEPATSNDVDLGSATKLIKDAYINGALKVNGSIIMPTTTITDILDEDTMVSDSATALATQQSIKAYVDASIAAKDQASEISYSNATSGLTATDVQAAIDEVDGDLDTHIADTTTHGTTGDIVGTTDIQTLTNKTLTSPTVNGGTHTNFTSTGINDDATSEQVTVKDSVVSVGNAAPAAWTTYKALQVGPSTSVMSATGAAQFINNAYYDNGTWRYVVDGEAGRIYMSGTGLLIYEYAASGTAGNAVTWTEAWRTDANGVFDLTKGQLKFPATQNPSTDANTLDDYEEGTWTAQVHDGLGNYSSSSVTGYYTKKGREVTATIGGLNSISTAGLTAGENVRFTFPFTSASTGGRAAGAIRCDSFTFTGYEFIVPVLSNGSSHVQIFKISNGGVDAGLTVGNIASGTSDLLELTITYFAAN